MRRHFYSQLVNWRCKIFLEITSRVHDFRCGLKRSLGNYSKIIFTYADVFMDTSHVTNTVNTSSRDQTNAAYITLLQCSRDCGGGTNCGNLPLTKGAIGERKRGEQQVTAATAVVPGRDLV